MNDWTWTTHPVVAPVLAGLILAVLIGLVRGLQKLLTEVRALRSDLGATNVQLVAHMGNEEHLRAQDLAERELRQEALDKRLGAIEGSVNKLSDGIGTLHRRIDDALVGNPEVRQPGPNYGRSTG